LKDVYISKLQFSFLIIGSITVTGHLVITSLVFESAGRDSWISLLLALVPAILIVYLISKVGGKFPKFSLAEIFAIAFNKPVGKLLTFLFFCYFMLVTILTFKLLINFMTTAFLPETPGIAIISPFLIIVIFALYSGLEGFARVYQFMLPLLILGGVSASVFSMPSKDYVNLLPILENGFEPVMLGALPLIGLFSELVVLGMIQNKVTPNSKPKIWLLNIISLIIIFLMFIGPLTGPISTFGSTSPKALSFPTYHQISYMKIDVFGNLQPIAIFLWVFGSFGKVSLFYYASVKTLQGFLGVNSYKKLIIPVGIAVLVLSLWLFPNLTVLKEFLSTFYIYMGAGLALIVPSLILILGKTKIS